MQDVESQWIIIQEWAKSSGANIDERSVFQELWSRVREKKVGTIVVAELSRLSRRMRTLVNFLYDCVERGVHVVSIREGWLNDALRTK